MVKSEMDLGIVVRQDEDHNLAWHKFLWNVFPFVLFTAEMLDVFGPKTSYSIRLVLRFWLVGTTQLFYV